MRDSMKLRDEFVQQIVTRKGSERENYNLNNKQITWFSAANLKMQQKPVKKKCPTTTMLSWWSNYYELWSVNNWSLTHRIHDVWYIYPQAPLFAQGPKKNELHATFRVFNLGIVLGFHVCTAPFKARSRPRLGFYILGIGLGVLRPLSSLCRSRGKRRSQPGRIFTYKTKTQDPHVMGDTHVKETPLKN